MRPATPASIPIQKRGIAALHAAIDASDAEAAGRACDTMEDEHAAGRRRHEDGLPALPVGQAR